MIGVSRLIAGVCLVALGATLGCTRTESAASEPHHSTSPAIKGNPAFDPTAPPRAAAPGRLLLRCIRPGDSRGVEIYASAKDFDDGKQMFYLKRWDQAKPPTLYPLHGDFLDSGKAGVFMIHDGKGVGQSPSITIDQTVNMGLLFLRTTPNGFRAVLNVYAEEDGAPVEHKELDDYSCESKTDAGSAAFNKNHVRSTPNTGAHPPSHWYRESTMTILSCTAFATDGEYHIELLGSSMWPAHLAFLLVRASGAEPVGYNVHMLEGPGRLLIHAHSYPHRSRVRMMDTMEETETVIGGLLLRKTESGYAGWIGLVSSGADPYNTSFSRDATMADYAALGHAVVPPLPVTCL